MITKQPTTVTCERGNITHSFILTSHFVDSSVGGDATGIPIIAVPWLLTPLLKPWRHILPPPRPPSTFNLRHAHCKMCIYFLCIMYLIWASLFVCRLNLKHQLVAIRLAAVAWTKTELAFCRCYWCQPLNISISIPNTHASQNRIQWKPCLYLTGGCARLIAIWNILDI